MITFDLECENAHKFEGWFRNREDFESQFASGMVLCPVCNSQKVIKLPSRVSVHTGKGSSQPLPAAPKEILSYYRALGDFLDKNFEQVGESFTEEALKMKRGESPGRSIKGVTTPAQEEELAEEGIEFFKVALPKYDA